MPPLRKIICRCWRTTSSTTSLSISRSAIRRPAWRSSTKCRTSRRPSHRQPRPRRALRPRAKPHPQSSRSRLPSRSSSTSRRRTTSRTSRVRWPSAASSIPAARRRTCPSTTSVWTISCPSARRISAAVSRRSRTATVSARRILPPVPSAARRSATRCRSCSWRSQKSSSSRSRSRTRSPSASSPPA